MQPKRVLLYGLLIPALFPSVASALVVEIQGKKLEPKQFGASCVDIRGKYPGLRIEPSEAGAVPRVCYADGKVNSISILKATFVAIHPVKQDVTVRFEHQFPPGINGKIMARAKLQGFFSNPDGLGVPSGGKIALKAFFSQTGKDDVIGEPFDLTVGEQLDDALFDYAVKEQYLIAGVRTLKGELKFSFREPGQKLTLPDRSAISIDSGSTFEDKLDTMALPEEDDESPLENPLDSSGLVPGADGAGAPAADSAALPEGALPVPSVSELPQPKGKLPDEFPMPLPLEDDGALPSPAKP